MSKVDPQHGLSVKRQCELLDVCRSSFYYIPQKDSSYNEELMKLIDLQYTQTPFYGVPRMVQHLRENGHRVNPKRIRRLYREMGLHAIGPRPNTSRPHKGAGHTIFPYLLRGVRVERPNQVWGMDITYVPVGDGHMYLMAIIDLYSRFVVGWSLSNTMTAEWCRECFEMAVSRHGAPEILNTDQGSQFTSPAFTAYVGSLEKTRFSMDGKGRAIDNIFIERFWRSIKYEKIYLEPSEDGHELYTKIKWYMNFYNTERGHQALSYQRPERVYRAAA
ncbi:MAG TPA: IS3 family transposase [Tenuifilaceae bacterium]|nr:IS3 family transposase [Bacteroidales bacterium]MDI9517190.1 IS3 family transposase [Bacteroidota bacterium]HNV82298.1 IS3 family transposase [Tenuifilaceae bacterium]HOF91629.1 IS3 family transposase [Tenuifilaceae bacterium]HOM85124.1 IS3 family transposase [Tenuifilaceae bacterium]